MKFSKQSILDLFNIRKEKNSLIKEESKLSSELKTYLETNSLTNLKYKNIEVSIGTRSKKQLDKELFTKEHPTIDIEKYLIDKPYEILNFSEL